MFLNLLLFLFIILILVLVHEFGHFLAARKSGVFVEEFGFGLPPRLFSFKKSGTVFSFNLFPLGGFVKLHGESFGEKISFPNQAFIKKPGGLRFLILLSGALMNLLLAFFVFSIVYFTKGIPRDTKQVKVIEVSKDSPAQEVGIKASSIIKKVDNVEVFDVSTFVGIINEKKGKEVVLTIFEEGKEREVRIVPRKDHPENEGPLGVVVSSVEIYYPPLWQRPFWGIYFGTKHSIYWGQEIIKGLKRVLFEAVRGKVPQDVAGPVGLFAITSEVSSFGALAVLDLVGVISLNLALLNLFPFPPLDGGRILLLVFEKTLGRKFLPKVETLINGLGFLILISLLVLVTINDLERFFNLRSIFSFFAK